LTIPRIYSPDALENKTTCELGPDNLKYIKQVMRLKQGDKINVFDGFGHEFESVIKGFTPKTVFIELGKRISQADKEIRITLAQAIPKAGKMDTIVKSAAELGADVIIPFDATRSVSRIAGEPLPADVQPVHSVATSTLAAWVRQTAAMVDTQPVNAKRAVVKYSIRITPARYGASVNQTKAVDLIAQALTDEAALASASRSVSLPIDAVPPKVTESSFGRAIVVSLSQCRVRLFDGGKLIKSYLCAPGRPAWPTPTGDFSIVRKLANSPWYNPHSTWSASMPDVIPGGPGNPMGDRKIGINYPGIFLHGIPASEYSSIGTHASHGCMRMMPSAVHDLYGRVKVGDPVFIRS